MGTGPTFSNPPLVDVVLGFRRVETDIGDTRALSRADDAASDAWSQTIDALLGLRELESDWDGAGSEPPPPALVHGSIRLAQALRKQGMPAPDGVGASINETVLFDWRFPGFHIELNVTSPTTATCRRLDKASREVSVTEVEIPVSG